MLLPLSIFLAVFFGLGFACSFYFQPSGSTFATRVRYVIGYAVALDYFMLWLAPMALQGAVHKELLLPYLGPLYERLDTSPLLRWFGETMIYQRPKHADYFATQLLFMLNFFPLMGLVFYWQMTHGELPWWLMVVYNFSWVGLGARGVGTAYFMAHKESHNGMMYKSWIRNTVGNVFENWFGCFYGGVPNNFTTTHIALHHRLDGGQGDTLYCWDINRSAWPDFLVYQCRGLFHMSGFGALYQFYATPERIGHTRHFWKLLRGVIIYWGLLPVLVIGITGSVFFYFWIVLQPMICMSFFLALINMGFHAFIENDDQGLRIPSVESITLVNGNDDFFGEDDHSAHHNYINVYWRDLPALQKKLQPEWERVKSSVFQGFDIFTFSLFILFKAWPLLADRYVDTSGKLSKAEICEMLQRRVTHREMDHTRLLPSMPPRRAKGYTEVPDTQPEEGSKQYQVLLGRLAKFQLSIATVMEMGLPPVKPLKELKLGDVKEE